MSPSAREYRPPQTPTTAHRSLTLGLYETALALRVTSRAVTQWLKWFVDEGLDRVAGIPHYWSPQRLPKTQEEAFRRAVEQLQDRRGGGRVRGEDIRQLLDEQFGVVYILNGVYELLKRLDMV